MKRISICILLLIAISCERMEDLNPPYAYGWLIANDATQDIVVWTNVEDVSFIDGNEFSLDKYYLIPMGSSCSICGMGSRKPNEKEFESFIQNLNFLKILSSDREVVLKEFSKDYREVSQDLYDVSFWGYTERQDYITHDYYITHPEWNFTITDADIGLEE